MRPLILVLVAVLASACASETIQLSAMPGQEAAVRDGVPSLYSKKQHIAMLRPNMRIVKGSARPAFTLAVQNLGSGPELLSETSIVAHQHVDGKQVALKVFKYDELVKEEQTRQAVAAFGAALSGVARAYNASNAGYVNTTGSVRAYNSYGGSAYGTYSATTYDPLRAQIAQNAASASTQNDFAALQEQGEANLAHLQNTILKDNTVMPGEWIGGTIVLDAPQSSGSAPKSYSIVVSFAGEAHEFLVKQTTN